jgi:hypothetical protein
MRKAAGPSFHARCRVDVDSTTVEAMTAVLIKDDDEERGRVRGALRVKSTREVVEVAMVVVEAKVRVRVVEVGLFAVVVEVVIERVELEVVAMTGERHTLT